MRITPEESVTVEWLHTPFKEPYFSARIDAYGDLYITSGLDFPRERPHPLVPCSER